MATGEPRRGRVRAADILAGTGVPWVFTPGGPVPYFTAAELAAAQREAEEMDYGARLPLGALARLPAGAGFPVTLAFAHERPGERYGPQIRCRVLLSAAAGAAVLDITPRRFDRLPWSD